MCALVETLQTFEDEQDPEGDDATVHYEGDGERVGKEEDVEGVRSRLGLSLGLEQLAH